jgi:hypothetical protein
VERNEQLNLQVEIFFDTAWVNACSHGPKRPCYFLSLKGG